MPISDKPLSSDLRAALNLIRAFAAVYVVFYHVAQTHFAGPLAAPLRFGQEAVILFFLLSGFVIFANERDRALVQPGAYLLRRVRRIYPPMLITLLLAYALYVIDSGYAGRFRVSELVGTLLSVQDISGLKPGVIVNPFLNTAPLWSLAYEMTFYLAFPVVLAAWVRFGPIATHVVGVVSVAGYASYVWHPNHWSLMAAYFIIWWAGAMLARTYQEARGVRAAAIVPTLAWLLATTCTAGAGAAIRGSEGIGVYPLLPVRHFAFALVCVVLTLTPIKLWVYVVARKVARPSAYVASISYGLYVFHYPLLINWSLARHSLLWFAVAVVVLVVMAMLFDRELEKRLPRPRSRKQSLAES